MGWLLLIALTVVGVALWWLIAGRFVAARKSVEVEQRIELSGLVWRARRERVRNFFR
jgi:hypothetical protein